MPYVIRWPHKRLFAATLVCLGLLFAAPGAALADGPHHDGGWGGGGWSGGGWGGFWGLPDRPGTDMPCPAAQGSKVFAQFGDNANYSLLPGGSFQGALTGWTLNGASVVAGNVPPNSGIAGDTQALSIQPGGQVLSSTFCLSKQFPTARFYVQSPGGNSGSLSVYVEWVTTDGQTGEAPTTTLNAGDYSSWAPSAIVPLSTALADGQKVNARLVFAADSGASWMIDDVFIDPYAK